MLGGYKFILRSPPISVKEGYRTGSGGDQAFNCNSRVGVRARFATAPGFGTWPRFWFLRRLQFSAARGTSRGLNRNRCQAVRTVFPGRVSVSHLVDNLNQKEDYQRDDQKVDNVVDERAVGYHGHGLGLCVGERNRHALRFVEHVEQTRKVDLAEQQSDGRHDDAVHKRGHDLAKGDADDYGYRQVNDVCAGNELFEFFEHWILLKWHRLQSVICVGSTGPKPAPLSLTILGQFKSGLF